eukprot:7380512-Prymnesium_polylepis.6
MYRPARSRLDLSMTISYQQYRHGEFFDITEEEDNEMDELVNNADLCKECGEPDAGYCVCADAEDNAGDLGTRLTTGHAPAHPPRTQAHHRVAAHRVCASADRLLAQGCGRAGQQCVPACGQAI